MAHAHRSRSAATLDPAGWPRSALAVWLAAAILAVSVHASAGAQEYRSDQPDMRAKADSGVATVCVQYPANYETDKERFTAYFRDYYFRAMTLYSPKDLEELGDLRYNLFSRYLWKAQSEVVQQDLTDLAYQAMGKIIVADNPPYHPAVRYNAVLVLGMLDQQYAIDSGANRRAPKPMPKANKFLVAAAKAGLEGKIPPALLVGALVGLDRHAQYHKSLAPEATAAMATVALEIINRDEPIQEVDEDVYTWMQLRAASVLANLGAVGQGSRNLNALLKLIAGGKSLDDRCRVAGLLKKINFQGATVDGKAAAEPLMQLALAVSQNEADRANKFRDRYMGGSGGRRDRGDRYGEESETIERRGMLTRLVDLQAGLQAVGTIAPDAEKTKLAAIVSAISSVVDAAEDDETVDLDLAKKMIEMAEAIEGVVSAAATPTATDAPKPSS
jgi:hypothetical protein